MMLTNKQFDVTKYLMQFCYTCADAGECTTEEKCFECWAAIGVGADLTEEIDETQELLRLYAQ